MTISGFQLKLDTPTSNKSGDRVDLLTEHRLSNHFLIAMPALADPNFERTVTLVCQHDDEGALGVVINRPLDVSTNEVLQQLDIDVTRAGLDQAMVYRGGPVQPELGLILHEKFDDQEDFDAMIEISDSIRLTMSVDVLESIASDDGLDRALIALGYAGWGPGQLDEEMAQNAWLSVPASSEIIFDTPPQQRWDAAARCIGVDLNLISNQSGHA